MTFKEKIYDKIAALKLNFFTERQLFVRLNVSSQDEKREIKSALTELVADGVFIVSDEGKYIAPQTIGAKRGVLQGNRRGFCFFIADDGGDDVFIPSNALNGAMHKDKVFVKVGPADSRGRFEGGVVSILERGVGRIIGVFRKRADGCGFVEPDDKDYFRDVFIRSNKTKGAQDGQKVVAKIGGFEGGKKPFGEITEILGKSGNPLVEVLAITRAFGFDDGFEKSVKKEAQAVVAEPFDTASREDMRGLLTVTIDGDDAKDLDDAVSLVKTDDGYKLYVHIADVSNYVRHKSILDNEAFERGTSVYFPGNVLPMLPEELSNGACSLNPRVDRPALTVEMLIDADGNVKGHKIYESVINSDERMTYKNAGKILDGDGSLTERYKAVAPMIRLMRELAGILNKKRVRRGSVFFEAKESVIDVDGDGRVLDIRPYDYGVANSIIEEFMLAANETVAEFVGHMEYPFIYRVHETPSVEKMREFGRFMSGIGIKIKVKEDVAPQEIQKYMDAAENTEYKHLVNKILLRSMQKARYDVINKGHFGL
ncbi:MAG: ribonuclease R, partial [Clostridiales bacterium]|nr:ribonuclease R [Clostridiales bacterium]